MRKHILIATIAAVLAFGLFTSVILGQSNRPCQHGARARICRITPTPIPTTTPAPVSFQFSIDDCIGGVVPESANWAYYVIHIPNVSNSPDIDAILTFQTLVEGTAIPHEDYEPVIFSITSDFWWPYPTMTAAVPIKVDAIDEIDEVLLVNIEWQVSTPNGTQQGTDTAQCVITDG